MSFIININAITLFILVQLGIISWSLVNTEISWIYVVFSLVTFFSFWSASGTSLIFHFCNQHCFLSQQNDGPLKHLFIWCYIFESKVEEASSAVLLPFSMNCHCFVLVWSQICWTRFATNTFNRRTSLLM